ncbi:unnamed protein product [Linum trigynum]|uniref:WAT1-related protein n=1 Tax=Linum trigynum TaxID=586398 RepID=A0AAV2GGE1_9ROSI
MPPYIRRKKDTLKHFYSRNEHIHLIWAVEGVSTTTWWWWCSDDTAKAYGAVVLTRLIYAGMFLVSKAAFDGGLNPSILVFYRQVLATVILAPLAFFLEWYVNELWIE